VFNFNVLRVGGDTWFDSILLEMAGFGVVARIRVKNYLMKSMGRLCKSAVFCAHRTIYKCRFVRYGRGPDVNPVAENLSLNDAVQQLLAQLQCHQRLQAQAQYPKIRFYLPSPQPSLPAIGGTGATMA
jgi:hypothetical protein